MMKKTAADILRDRLTSTHLSNKVAEKIHPKLDEIAGIKYLEDDIRRKMYNPLFHQPTYSKLGHQSHKSLLIYGIEGVGRTFLVSCFSKQYNIPIITKFVENSSDIRELFRQSKTTDMSIILITNLDSILDDKAMTHQIEESIKKLTWNALVIFIHKERIHTFKFDTHIFVKIPNLERRREIIESLLSKMKCEDVDSGELAYYTPGFVPADLIKLIGMATSRAIIRITSSSSPGYSNSSCEFVTMKDFMDSIKEWKNIEQLITFDDIGAMHEVKEELRNSIFLPSQFPEKFRRFGIVRPSGILLHGPPGCGKTLIAKAVANMSHCNFLSIKGPELITKYVGDSEKHLRQLFERAKNLSPCVLFFDEIDSLCGKRGKNEFGNRIVNQILTLLDGMEDRGEVYLIGATNRIKSIDRALMRPGRFDKIIEVPLPKENERLEIFSKCIRNLPAEQFDFSLLNLDGFSSADISGIVKESAILCLRDNFSNDTVIIAKEYFIKAIEKHRSMQIYKKKSKINR